ncbi:rod shape-determining protein MreC [bacterium]|nr:rod shape-determining protein MreC [bacterium]
MQTGDKFTKYIAAFILTVVIIVGLSFFNFLSPVKDFFGKTFSPMFSYFDNVAFGLSGKSKPVCNTDQELETKLKELTIEIAGLRELKKENETLRNELGFIEKSNLKIVSSEVIVKDPSNFSQTFTVNKGSNSGVRKNMAVTSGGFLIGKIIEVNSSSSVARILTDSNFEVSAIVQESNALGLIKGQIGSGIVMDTIPQDKEVKKNDIVVTSTLDTVIPSGIIIGRVSDIDKTSQGLFQKASIVPLANLENIKYVTIILGE